MFTKESLSNIKYIDLCCSREFEKGYFRVPSNYILDLNINENGEGDIILDNAMLNAPYVQDDGCIGVFTKLNEFSIYDIVKIVLHFYGGEEIAVKVENSPLYRSGQLEECVLEWSNCPQFEKFEDSFKLIFGGAKRVDDNYFDLVYGLDKVLSKRKMGTNILRCEIVELNKNYYSRNFTATLKVVNEGYTCKKIRLLFEGVDFSSMDFMFDSDAGKVCELYMSRSAFNARKIYVSLCHESDDFWISFTCSRIFSISFGNELQRAYLDKYRYDPSLFFDCKVNEDELRHLSYLGKVIDYEERTRTYRELFSKVVSLYQNDEITSSYLACWLNVLEDFVIEDYQLEKEFDIFEFVEEIENATLTKDEIVEKLLKFVSLFEYSEDALFRGVIFKSEDMEHKIKFEDIVSFTINGMSYGEFLWTNDDVETYELVLKEPITYCYLTLSDYTIKIPAPIDEFRKFEIRSGEDKYISNSLWLGNKEFSSYSQTCTKEGNLWIYRCDMKRTPSYFSTIEIEQEVKDILGLPYDAILTEDDLSKVEVFYVNDDYDFTCEMVDDLSKMPNLKKLYFYWFDFSYNKNLISYLTKKISLEEVSFYTLYDHDVAGLCLLSNVKKIICRGDCCVSEENVSKLPPICKEEKTALDKYVDDYDNRIYWINKSLNHKLISLDEYNQCKETFDEQLKKMLSYLE